MFRKTAVAMALGALALTACTSTQPEQPGGTTTESPGGTNGQIIVGLITKTETNPFFVKMKEGAQAEADKLGAKLLTGAGTKNGDNESQVTAMENMLNAGAKGILITPNDPKAIVPSIQKAREAGALVIALDGATNPADAPDALFATDNFKAGILIGEWAAKAMGGKAPVITTIDLGPTITVGVQRHNGFLQGMGLVSGLDSSTAEMATSNEVVCSQNANGDTSEAQTAMENCLSKNPEINLVYSIDEVSALGAHTALKNAGRDDVLIVTVDGGCAGVQSVKDGAFAATSQQYPLKMAALGVEAVVKFAQGGERPSGFTDTGVTLITDKPQDGVPSEDSTYGLANCWGK